MSGNRCSAFDPVKKETMSYDNLSSAILALGPSLPECFLQNEGGPIDDVSHRAGPARRTEQLVGKADPTWHSAGDLIAGSVGLSSELEGSSLIHATSTTSAPGLPVVQNIRINASRLMERCGLNSAPPPNRHSHLEARHRNPSSYHQPQFKRSNSNGGQSNTAAKENRNNT